MPTPAQINPSEDPKTLKQCPQLTKQENDTCCFGEIVNVPICKTCAPNQMLYNGKCTDTTDLGCCFLKDPDTAEMIFGYICNMKTGENCRLTTENECPKNKLDWAALGSNADLGFATPTCSLDLSFSSSPD